MVHQARFKDANQRGEPTETALKHAQAAKQHYLEAIDVCPSTALIDLSHIHAQFGSLYGQVGDFDRAREHYEKAAQYYERTDNHYDAGRVRRDISRLYMLAAKQESVSARQRDLMLRAQAYAEGALRDFEHFKGRAAEEEDEAQQHLAAIAQALADLPPE